MNSDIIIQIIDPVDGTVIAEGQGTNFIYFVRTFGFRFINAKTDDEILLDRVKALRNGSEYFPVGFYRLHVKPTADAS